ncbi:hypothetical protein EHS25_005419 [Saitozyma podzolica]|uniref:Acetyltransferase n=1 Tax=Saitozyma podzolica TaxID=1890683 RepID=A0A427XY30_9TREE|nr:hypothetical protein EHS25_005419 [Saitozyma podzolica]
MTYGFLLSGIADPGRLKSALEELVRRWPLLGSTIVRREDGRYAYLPWSPLSPAPPITFQTHHSSLPSTSVCPLPRPTPRPSIQNISTAPLFRPPPELHHSHFDSYAHTSPPQPIVHLQVNTYADDTSAVSVTMPHCFADAGGVREILAAWVGVLKGEQVPMTGMDTLFLENIGSGSGSGSGKGVDEDALRADRSGGAARRDWIDWNQADSERTTRWIFVPNDYLSRLKHECTAELREREAAQRDYGDNAGRSASRTRGDAGGVKDPSGAMGVEGVADKEGAEAVKGAEVANGAEVAKDAIENPGQWVSEGDVLLAWWLKTVYSTSEASSSSNTTSCTDHIGIPKPSPISDTDSNTDLDTYAKTDNTLSNSHTDSGPTSHPVVPPVPPVPRVPLAVHIPMDLRNRLSSLPQPYLHNALHSASLIFPSSATIADLSLTDLALLSRQAIRSATSARMREALAYKNYITRRYPGGEKTVAGWPQHAERCTLSNWLKMDWAGEWMDFGPAMIRQETQDQDQGPTTPPIPRSIPQPEPRTQAQPQAPHGHTHPRSSLRPGTILWADVSGRTTAGGNRASGVVCRKDKGGVWMWYTLPDWRWESGELGQLGAGGVGAGGVGAVGAYGLER